MNLRRLRSGEVIAGLAGLAALVLLFAGHWSGAHGGQTGWRTEPVLRWLIVVTALSGIALTVAQAALRSPAVPVSLSVIITVLGALTTVVVIISLLVIGGVELLGFAGWLAVAAVTVGAFRSLREEDGWVPGPEHPIPTISLGAPDGR
jgi:hypothetical protein